MVANVNITAPEFGIGSWRNRPFEGNAWDWKRE
jgi:hypothetical protein